MNSDKAIAAVLEGRARPLSTPGAPIPLLFVDTYPNGATVDHRIARLDRALVVETKNDSPATGKRSR